VCVNSGEGEMKLKVGYWDNGETAFVSLDSETLMEQDLLKKLYGNGVEIHSFGTVLEGTGSLIIQSRPPEK
jgi:hypothetical protein